MHVSVVKLINNKVKSNPGTITTFYFIIDYRLDLPQYSHYYIIDYPTQRKGHCFQMDGLRGERRPLLEAERGGVSLFLTFKFTFNFFTILINQC